MGKERNELIILNMNLRSYAHVFEHYSEGNWRFFFLRVGNDLAFKNYGVVNSLQKEKIKCTLLIKLKLSSVLCYVTIVSLVWCHAAFKWPSEWRRDDQIPRRSAKQAISIYLHYVQLAGLRHLCSAVRYESSEVLPDKQAWDLFC
jgi:hypothetical protein